MRACKPIRDCHKDREQWRPIATAPADGSVVLAFVPPARLVAVSWRGRYWHDAHSGIVIPFPTHWRPLPVPPWVEDC